MTDITVSWKRKKDRSLGSARRRSTKSMDISSSAWHSIPSLYVIFVISYCGESHHRVTSAKVRFFFHFKCLLYNTLKPPWMASFSSLKKIIPLTCCRSLSLFFFIENRMRIAFNGLFHFQLNWFLSWFYSY